MKSKRIIAALVCGLCLLTACNSTSTTKKNKSSKDKDSKKKVEDSIDEEDETEAEVEETTKKEAETEETTKKHEEEIIDVEPSEESVSRVCIGKSISFEVPEDSWYEDYSETYMREYYSVFMYPDPEYQEVIIEGNAWKDSMASFTTKEELEAQVEEILASPVDYLDINCEAKQMLGWFYDEDITDAAMASECCYKDYVDTGYAIASTPTKNATGKFTTEIDGRTCYVVWHSGSSDNPLFNMITYECYCDLSSGEIMEIMYYDGSSTQMNNVQYVLDSIKFI